jgi:putative PIN family toxin of toxin-antitoxin system
VSFPFCKVILRGKRILKTVRVVLDTNILISACLKPDGLEAQVVALARSRAVTACVSPEIWNEYEEVLSRPKFTAIRETSALLLTALRNVAEQVATTQKMEIALDEDDNRFLECAFAGRADYLITGNLRHFPANYESTAVVNARGFMTCYAATNPPTELK